MKYECGSCKALMAFQTVEEAPDAALRIAFGCPSCGHRIFLIANPQEAQLVRSMGIILGGVEEHQPLGLVRSTLRGIREELSPSMEVPGGKEEEPDKGPVWDEEAEKGLEKAPAPIRHMARAAIERYAQEQGHKRITLQVVAEAREKRGL